jgi:mycothiol synthase
MKIQQLTTETMVLFINYCKKYRDELSDEYIEDVHLDKFYPDEENPTYVLLDDKSDIVGVVSLIIDSYHREGKTGRFRIFHSSIPEKKY